MRVQHEFTKFADAYGNYNSIQKRVVEELISTIPQTKPQRVLDLGCGNGLFYKQTSWPIEHFMGVDFAPRMLELHPKGENIECIYGDFNDPALFEQLAFYEFDRIVSASALQWAEDLERTFGMIAALNAPISLAIFTSGTFKTLYESAQIEPLIRSQEEVVKTAQHFFTCKAELKTYALEFNDVREMFRYIKRSGVSGNRNVLNYKQTKALMRDYPLNYLEFEVLFLTT